MKYETVHPSVLKAGDTVMIKGEMRTLGRHCVKGMIVKGIRYASIERALFPKWYKGEIVSYQPQI